MDWGRLPYHVDLYRENGAWKLRVNENLINERGFKEHGWRDPVHIGPATGPERMTRKEAQRVVWEKLPLGQSKNGHSLHNSMTIAHFVEHMFVPEHVAIKGLSGRTHYRAILKHVLTPEEVQNMFKVDLERSKIRLKAVSGWPYLSDVALTEVKPEHIENLVRAAVDRGYSSQTVTHIRNVVSAIFSHARKGSYFTGENPAGQVTVPGMCRKEAYTLSLPQLRAVLVTLTGMNVAEICGLQWKHVNLSAADVALNGDLIPSRTIAVRKHWYRGELNSVKIGRTRDLAISNLMLPVFFGLNRRVRYSGPDDFVLVSEAGTPVNETNIASRRLKSIGQDLGMPWLSWHVFRRTRKDYLTRFGSQFEGRLTNMVNP
jgi:integrase